MKRYYYLIACLLLVYKVISGPNACSTDQDSTGRDVYKRPTIIDFLAERGFEASPEGLTGALESKDKWAIVYALQVILENNDDNYLGYADSLLNADDIKIQVEAARLLAHFNRPNGIEWLQQWENINIDIHGLSVDTIHALLDIASALAKSGDERQAGCISRIFMHKSWSVRMHAARVLGNFNNLDNPEIQDAWIASVDIALKAVKDSLTRMDYVELYLQWLVHSFLRLTDIPTVIYDKFTSLALYDHPVISRTVRKQIMNHFKSQKRQEER